ncbi:MAG: PocR ligand-binding domain-containing protein [Nitrospirota bacterium]
MELTDIMPVENWRQLAEDIYNLFGFNGAVLDKNNMLVHSSTKWANDLCPVIRSGDNRIVCVSAQKRLSKVAEDEREPVIDECDAGFVKFVVPVFSGDEFLGTVSGCGCLLDNSEADAFYVSKLLNKEEEAIKVSLTTVHRVSKDRVKDAIKYVQQIINRH